MGNICPCFKSAPEKKKTPKKPIPPPAPPLPSASERHKSPTSSESTKSESLSTGSDPFYHTEEVAAPIITMDRTSQAFQGIPVFYTGRELTRPLPPDHECFREKPVKIPYQSRTIEGNSDDNFKYDWHVQEMKDPKEGRMRTYYLGYERTIANQLNDQFIPAQCKADRPQVSTLPNTSDDFITSRHVVLDATLPNFPLPSINAASVLSPYQGLPPIIMPTATSALPIQPSNIPSLSAQPRSLTQVEVKSNASSSINLSHPTAERPKAKKRHKRHAIEHHQKKNEARAGGNAGNADIEYVMSPI